MNNTAQEKKYLSLVQKVGYGVGDFGSNYCWTFVAAFIMLYCTNIIGVSAGVVGVIMMLSKFLDGISDAIMGRIIDKTKSKMGKARFWYAVSAFPVALCTFLLFNVPSIFSESTKYVYIFIVYTLMGVVFYTMNNIAYSAMTALITRNPDERVQLGSYRFICSLIAVILISTYTSGLVDFFGGGQRGWMIVSLIYSVICFICLYIPVLLVKELPESETENAEKKDEQELKFGQAVGYLLKNKYFVMILLWYLINYLFGGIFQGLGVYYATYNLNNAGLLGALSMAGMLPQMIVLFAVPSITAKYGIRKVSIWGSIVGALGAVVVFVGGNTANGFVFVMAGLILKSAGIAPLAGGINALIAEADDYSLYKFGHRITGMMYSCSSVGLKVGTGIGTALTGLIVEFARFDGTAAVQSAFTLNVFSIGYILSIALAPISTLIICYFMDVEKVNKKLKAEAGRKE